MAIDWYYPRPELAKSYLEEFSRRAARALTVFAERGLGKTAFLHRDLTPEAVARDRLPVYVDVWAVRTDPAAGISGQLKAATQGLEHKDPSKREVTNFSVSVLGIGGGVTTAHRPEPGEPTNELSRINFWSDRLAQLAGEKTILLMLDEVQELAIHPDGASVAAALRASMQRNYGRFEPVFTGSQRDKLLQMFAVSKAPIFEFGDDIDFPPLTRAFSAFVADHLKQEGGIELDVNQLHAAFVALGYTRDRRLAQRERLLSRLRLLRPWVPTRSGGWRHTHRPHRPRQHPQTDRRPRCGSAHATARHNDDPRDR